MKKVLLILLGIIVVVGILGGAGFVAYRTGFNQGTRFAVSKQMAQLPSQNKNLNPNGKSEPNSNREFGFQNMPGRNFGNDRNHGFNRGMGPGSFGMMMQRGRGFGFFGPFQFLFRIAIFVFIIWIVYMLFKSSGWTLTRQPAVVKVEPQVTEPKNEEPG